MRGKRGNKPFQQGTSNMSWFSIFFKTAMLSYTALNTLSVQIKRFFFYYWCYKDPLRNRLEWQISFQSHIIKHIACRCFCVCMCTYKYCYHFRPDLQCLLHGKADIQVLFTCAYLSSQRKFFLSHPWQREALYSINITGFILKFHRPVGFSVDSSLTYSIISPKCYQTDRCY